MDHALQAVHLAGLFVWLGTALFVQGRLLAARRRGEAEALSARRRLHRFLVIEHAAFALAVGSGFLLLQHRHWGLGHARWLAVKIGLTLFLLVPLEAMHAWICHVWIARGLAQTASPPYSKDLARGIGMDDMLRALAAPLLALAVPLLVWLSLRHPF